jgi:hypothetical protein
MMMTMGHLVTLQPASYARKASHVETTWVHARLEPHRGGLDVHIALELALACGARVLDLAVVHTLGKHATTNAHASVFSSKTIFTASSSLGSAQRHHHREDG